jgi:hypothetical protein
MAQQHPALNLLMSCPNECGKKSGCIALGIPLNNGEMTFFCTQCGSTWEGTRLGSLKNVRRRHIMTEEEWDQIQALLKEHEDGRHPGG